MLKKACMLCRVAGALVIVGAINWGLVGVADINLVDRFLGVGSTIGRVVYILVGISGLALLASYFMTCPACKKSG